MRKWYLTNVDAKSQNVMHIPHSRETPTRGPRYEPRQGPQYEPRRGLRHKPRRGPLHEPRREVPSKLSIYLVATLRRDAGSRLSRGTSAEILTLPRVVS